MTDHTPEQLTTDVLKKVIDALQPLSSEERHRAVQAALTFLGETAPAAAAALPGRPGRGPSAAAEGDGGGQSDFAAKWMEKYGVSPEELEHVFHLPGDGTFDIHDVPGTSKKEKTISTYILTGVGHYLVTGNKNFTDDQARTFCKNLGCYDIANHANTLDNYRGPEFSGNKKQGFMVTVPGLKRGAELVKDQAGAASR